VIPHESVNELRELDVDVIRYMKRFVSGGNRY